MRSIEYLRAAHSKWPTRIPSARSALVARADEAVE
jgi:hypothetical protein